MMTTLLAMTEVAMQPVAVPLLEWNVVNHDFACDLNTDHGQVIPIEGAIKIVAYGDDKTNFRTRGSFDVWSKDKDWNFLRSHWPYESCCGMLGKHSIYLDVSDRRDVDHVKNYSLQLSFASRLDGIQGPYGHAVLYDLNKDVARARDGSDFPILATGICQMNPKAGSVQ